ncbi:MAG TPA: flagellar protein export ATPase FliI [Anaerolineae bacterium]|nr:flagellar protein export ATPase FliI [Anaerolineae bacterium]HMR64308.1 flagellar protein export ATPase FliI [Anaerolineae bacterium]
MTFVVNWDSFHQTLADTFTLVRRGRVTQVIGLTLEAEGIHAQIGEICTITSADQRRRLLAEVMGFRDDRTLLMPLGEINGISPGSAVEASGSLFKVPVGHALLGRVVDGLGRPLDDKGPLLTTNQVTVDGAAPPPLGRIPIKQPLETGVRAIDSLLTVGKGQRMGIFAGSGVGKSTTLGMIARHAKADISVIALIGERGREVQEFIDRDLGPEGLARSVVVVSTSDQPALVRLKGAWVATSIAEFFRDLGHDVVFMMDSVTRFAMAQREIGLAIGEPPTMKGYTPSVFALLPKLLERTGTGQKGTITGFYTVLVESDDLTEPVTDAVRSILDGHIVLSRDLAAQNHYPAIQVLDSVSRVMPAITSDAHRQLAARLRDLLATYHDARDLINIGAYAEGTNPQIDQAIAAMPAILSFLRQGANEPTLYPETLERLHQIVGHTI